MRKTGDAPLKMLFVCSRNYCRSLTAERLFDGEPAYEARSAGTQPGARVVLTPGLIGWADIVFFMERSHFNRAHARYSEELQDKATRVLHIPDDYEFMQPELIHELRARLEDFIPLNPSRGGGGAAMTDCNTDEVLGLLAPFKDDLESGRVSDDDFVTQGMERIRFRATREEYIRIWSDIFTENPPMTSAVKELAATHPLYLLSNTSGLHKEWLFANFGVFTHFTGGIYSHEAHCMKPDEPIFHAAIDAFQLDPARTFYMDDLPDNIATGRRLGFVCHQYDPDRHEEFQRALDTWVQKESSRVSPKPEA